VYGVIVRRDCTDNLRLLAHEFVHVAHYERLGREGFLQEYIQQIAAHGYLNAPFELEAEARLLRHAGMQEFILFEPSQILSIRRPISGTVRRPRSGDTRSSPGSQ
jgi:hypothetical protein